MFYSNQLIISVINKNQ